MTSVLSLLESLSIFDYGVLAVAVLVGFIFLRQRRQNTPVNPSQNVNFKVIAPTAVQSPTSSSFVDKMKATGRTIVVFYGSQTGTAEDFANRLAKGSAAYGLKAMAVDPEECEMEDLNRLKEIPKSLAIFCMATYGEGDPTDNAQAFCEWLKQDDIQLDGLNYTVFALGNRTYEHFNETGLFVDKRLEAVGAHRVFPIGLGDDDGNIEEDFVVWQDEMWRGVCAHLGISAEAQDVLIRQYAVDHPENLPPEKVFNGEIARLNSFKNQRPPYDAKNPFLSSITTIRELHNGGDRSCMHIELDITGARLRYESGDHVAVYPVNRAELVESIGKRLNVNLDQVFTLNNVDEDSSKRHPFPCPCTYRTALTHYVDITSAPKTNVLREIAEYASDEKDKVFLKKMAANTEEGKGLYSDFIVRSRRHILAVLEDIPSVAPPLDILCELLPRLQARYYSISSSPKMHPNTIHITAVLVDYVTSIGRPMKGVATTWLASKRDYLGTDSEKVKIPIFVRRSQFRLPYKSTTPVIMVGPGTGLAPFRGFIQDRLHAKREGKPMGETVLYFGCRKQSEDYIYQQELAEALTEGALTHLYCAFSRDGGQKEYVQHLMKRPENASQLFALLEKGGHFYVCGDAKNMARDVLSTLENIISEYGQMSSTQAQEYIKRLQNKGRYSADVWS